MAQEFNHNNRTLKRALTNMARKLEDDAARLKAFADQISYLEDYSGTAIASNVQQLVFNNLGLNTPEAATAIIASHRMEEGE